MSKEKTIVFYTKEEKLQFLNIMTKYQDFFEGKDKKAQYNITKKRDIWKLIEKEYNVLSTKTGTRTAEQLENLYKNLKRKAKIDAQRENASNNSNEYILQVHESGNNVILDTENVPQYEILKGYNNGRYHIFVQQDSEQAEVQAIEEPEEHDHDYHKQPEKFIKEEFTIEKNESETNLSEEVEYLEDEEEEETNNDLFQNEEKPSKETPSFTRRFRRHRTNNFTVRSTYGTTASTSGATMTSSQPANRRMGFIEEQHRLKMNILRTEFEAKKTEDVLVHEINLIKKESALIHKENVLLTKKAKEEEFVQMKELMKLKLKNEILRNELLHIEAKRIKKMDNEETNDN